MLILTLRFGWIGWLSLTLMFLCWYPSLSCVHFCVSSSPLTERRTSDNGSRHMASPRCESEYGVAGYQLERKLCHPKDFSPVWVFMCVFRFHDREKAFSQVKHTKRFSPEWVNWCCFRPWDKEKYLPHCWQPNVFSLLWDFRWVFRQLDRENVFSQVVHS